MLYGSAAVSTVSLGRSSAYQCGPALVPRPADSIHGCRSFGSGPARRHDPRPHHCACDVGKVRCQLLAGKREEGAVPYGRLEPSGQIRHAPNSRSRSRIKLLPQESNEAIPPESGRRAPILRGMRHSWATPARTLCGSVSIRISIRIGCHSRLGPTGRHALRRLEPRRALGPAARR